MPTVPHADPAAEAAAHLGQELAEYCRDLIAVEANASGTPDPIVVILANLETIRRLSAQVVATYDDPAARAKVADMLRGYVQEGVVRGLVRGRT